jgi:hypothetical protein
MKKIFLWLAGAFILCSCAAGQADPIQDNAFKTHQLGWYPNSSAGGGSARSCDDICQAVGAVAEQESGGMDGTAANPVCKVSSPYGSWSNEMYGNQMHYNGHPACYYTSPSGMTQASYNFHCLCISGATAGCPDLVVEKLLRVVWNPKKNKTYVIVRLKNIGGAMAEASTVSLTDQSNWSRPYSTTVSVPLLCAGESIKVIFALPYKIRNPYAKGIIQADCRNAVRECRENNNMKWIWL